jgi:serine/threonine-protein kinase
MSSDPSAKRQRRPVRIGKYEVVTHIATGGMGAVYKAIDSVLKREVALKVLPPAMASNPLALERFRREARNAARLRHENIVTIYEFDQSGSTLYLAMEFVEGIDLLEYITRKGRLDPEEARLIAIQATRALEHAHRQGVVHRDVKPSNFLVCRKGDTLVVKLSDFGLARETSDEDGRVTRDGTTVGTVDYMAPEQAKDAGQADCRSDIYAMGCTLFHMLTGRAPFPDGSIPERLRAHAQDPPPDLQDLNPRVSEGLCAIVRRMLAKTPADRYPNPAALLKDLVHLGSATAATTGRNVLADLAMTAEESDTGTRRAAGTVRTPRPAAPRGPHGLRDEVENRPRPDDTWGSLLRERWVWGVGGGALAVVLAVVALYLAFRSPRPASTPVVEGSLNSAGPTIDCDPGPTTEPDRGPPIKPPVVQQKPPVLSTPPRGGWPKLYEAKAPPTADTLAKDFLAPWARVDESGSSAPVLKVARLTSGAFPSLDAACAAAVPGRLSVIEINDNGPLFTSPVALAGRSLVIRAGRGFRPLLVWDAGARRAGSEPGAFLALARGSLTLKGLDLVGRGPDDGTGRTFLVRVSDGDLLARDCTFSMTGRPPGEFAAVRFERSDASGAPSATAARCRLSHCATRGPGLVALDIDCPGADVLLDGCLAIGTYQPLVQVAGRNLAPTVLRLLRSTLVGSQSTLLVRPATAADTEPELHVRAWDALLSHAGAAPGGQMAIVLNGHTTKMKWQAINCLYAGWRTLLLSADNSIEDIAAWQSAWGRTEGEMLEPSGWPVGSGPDPCEAGADQYRPLPAPESPVGYAATSGSQPGPLGCDLSALPPLRTNWLALGYDSFPTPHLPTIEDDKPPNVPDPGDGKYHGGRIDLAQTPDLGALLDEMHKTKGFGPRVVLRLAGSGEYRTGPIHVRGATLVLYFEPGEAGKAPPVLVPRDKLPPGQTALIDVDGGGLDIIHGELRLPDNRAAQLPAYALRVSRGDLRLFRCRLTGPLTAAPHTYSGLVDFAGISPEPRPEKEPACCLNECVLVTDRTGLHVAGTGARVGLRQCVLATGGDAIHFEPGATVKGKLDVHCLLEQTTIAGQRSAVRLGDAPLLDARVEPIVLECRASAFLNPFTSTATLPSLLALDGAGVTRGMLIWQGSGNLFDKRLNYDGVPKTDAAAAWARQWGSVWAGRQTLDAPLTATLDLARPELDRLALPQRSPPGADFERLGVWKKTPP